MPIASSGDVMNNDTLSVKSFGHSLELRPLGDNRFGEAFQCLTCKQPDCSQIARFNKYYQVKLDPKSPKGWHVVESK